MRFWPSAALRHVIRFTVPLVSVVMLAACGGGADNTLVSELTGPDDNPPVKLGFATPDTETLTSPISSQLTAISGADSESNEQPSPFVEPSDATDSLRSVSATVPEASVVPEIVDTSTDSGNLPAGAIPEKIVVKTDEEEKEDVTAEVEAVEETEKEAEKEAEKQAEVSSGSEEPASSAPSQQFGIGNDAGDVVKLIDSLETSIAQTNVQQTPIATANGFLYTANIEHGPRGDVAGYDLHTVVRQGWQEDDGDWSWESTVVEDRTIQDKWHTAPSVEVDKQGLVHVVYNLHNFPWQYKRTTRPHDLTTFEFLGQAVSDEEIRLSVEENRTSFPTLGKAAIPGNQITYPAFFKDRNNDLYLSYRFAATPKQSFSKRTMSAGISVYNSTTQTWTAIGDELSLTTDDYEADPEAGSESIAIAAKRGWTSYHPRLVFDQNNKMFVNWFWRNGTAGAMLTHPCLISTTDRFTFTDTSGNLISLPVEPDQCGNLGYSNNQEFYSVGNTAINSSGEVHIILSPDSGSRKIVHYDASSQEWRRQDAPYNATEIFFDAEDTLWAIASGIRIYKRPEGDSSWETVYDDSSSDNCYPKATMSEDNASAFIHAEACDGGSVTVYGMRLK